MTARGHRAERTGNPEWFDSSPPSRTRTVGGGGRSGPAGVLRVDCVHDHRRHRHRRPRRRAPARARRARRRLPRAPARGDRATSSTTARACCACSARAGASRRSTSSPPRCCASAGAGPTLIVSPLLALMRNQIAAAERLGIRAHTINSTNRDAWDEVQRAARGRRGRPAADQPRAAQQPAVPRRRCCRCSPSGSGCWWSTRRTASPTGATTSGPTTGASPTCSSGCRRASPVLCTTATANDRVVADVAEQLQRRPRRRAAHLPRAARRASSLRLEVVDLPGQAERLAWLATHLPQLPGSGIVYTLTKRDADAGRRVARRPRHRRRGLQRRAVDDRARGSRSRSGCCATTSRRSSPPARWGWATTSPTSASSSTTRRPARVIAYYQQVGRAGRAIEHADVVLLRGARGPPHPGLLHRAGVPARASVVDAGARARSTTTDGATTHGADGARSTSARAASRRC